MKREVTRRCAVRQVLWGSRWQEPLAEQQPRHREVGWEGSCKQTPGPRNTKRIRGVLEVGEGARRPEARCHPDQRGVDATGVWEESHAPYPGRSAHLPLWLVALRGEAKDEQKSAEAEVAAAHSGEGLNTRSRVGTKRSMSEEDVDKKAEKLERTRKVGGGTAEGTGPARQALTARGENAEAEARLLTEEAMRGFAPSMRT